MKSEIKEIVQETNSERKETGTQINDLEQKEEVNILEPCGSLQQNLLCGKEFSCHHSPHRFLQPEILFNF